MLDFSRHIEPLQRNTGDGFKLRPETRVGGLLSRRGFRISRHGALSHLLWDKEMNGDRERIAPISEPILDISLRRALSSSLKVDEASSSCGRTKRVSSSWSRSFISRY